MKKQKVLKFLSEHRDANVASLQKLELDRLRYKILFEFGIKYNDTKNMPRYKLVDLYLDEMCGKDHVEEADKPGETMTQKLARKAREYMLGKKTTKNLNSRAAQLAALRSESEQFDEIFSESAYQEYFKSKLAKRGVKSPMQLNPDERKKFFDDVKAGWSKKSK